MADLDVCASFYQEQKRDQGQKQMGKEDREVEPVPERTVIPVRKKDRADGARHDEHKRDFREEAADFPFRERGEQVHENAEVAQVDREKRSDRKTFVISKNILNRFGAEERDGEDHEEPARLLVVQFTADKKREGDARGDHQQYTDMFRTKMLVVDHERITVSTDRSEDPGSSCRGLRPR